MKTMMHGFKVLVLAALVVAPLGVPLAMAAETSAQGTAKAQGKAVSQTAYATPEAAVSALYEAIRIHDVGTLRRILGPASLQLLESGDEVADRQARERFVTAYEQYSSIEYETETRATLLVGDNEWPFPYPLVKSGKGWRYDAKAGAEEIINRRIGANELSAIETCLAIGDAQFEYASVDRDGDGLLEYAQKFLSSAGKRDGLYWPTTATEPLSPLGPLAAMAWEEGYRAKPDQPTPYHGYYYRILKSQGPHATGGAYDYLVKDSMIGGFAIAAYPAKWGASGVMTFICNHDGVVYQRNLGSNSAAVAKKMKRFDPGTGWSRVPAQE